MIKLHWGGKRNAAENQIMADFAANLIWPDGRKFGECTTLGMIEDDVLIGVAVFHNYDPVAKTIEYSGASKSERWLTKKSVRAIFSYMFDDIGCQMVVTRNSERNTRLHRQLEAYGHQPHRIERLRGVTEAEIVWTLTREQWNGNKFNKGNVTNG